jgi:hypothetical protein
LNYQGLCLLSLIRKFISLNRIHKIAFIEAYVLLGVIRFAILTLPFRWLTHSLVQSTESDVVIKLLNLQQQSMLSIVACSIRQAAVHTPLQSVCLPQALTAYRMLHRRGVPGQLYLGLRKDAKSADPLEAHAWAQAGDTIITGEKGHETFTVISVFTWGQP